MKYLLTALFALVVFISQPALAGERTTVLDVENMTCALCPITVSKALKGVDGVSSVKVDMDAKTATVVYDDAVAELTEIADASTFAGYPATARK